ncbi:MAG: tetratricopeptide repeat protein [Desulfobulbaceae bacterium]|nr:tetratricopeptide repeat protein [Desulfobulbaceae bacterium]
MYIAFTAASLWALNPVQTQAVTYLVQRMASLAALFYIYAMLSYVLARRKPVNKSWPLYLLTIFFFLLSILSKENGILLPCSLLLIELVFITEHEISLNSIFLILFLGATLSYFLFLLLTSWKFSFLSGYDERSFTMIERLLTEPRIVIYYISLLLFPAPSRLSLVYDFPVSVSLLSPWTTLGAIIFLLGMAIGAMLLHRKTSIISFAVLFFLLNHVVESTILPLELVFEHRNYLPSIFFFWPIASALITAIRYFSPRKRPLSLLLLALTCSSIIIFGGWTFFRNSIWKDEKTIWTDVMRKHPGLGRPYQMLAMLLESGEYNEEALRLYQIALEKQGPDLKTQEYVSRNNMGLIYRKTGRYEQAIASFDRALVLKPGSDGTFQNLIATYLHIGDYSEAERLTDLALSFEINEQNIEYLRFKAFALQKQNFAEKALEVYSQKILKLEHHNSEDIINFALALAQHGDYEAALQNLDQIAKSHQSSIYYRLAALENELRGGTREKADMLAAMVLTDFSQEQLDDIFNESKRQLSCLDLSLLQHMFEK